MKQIRQGNALDMYYRTFPGDPYVLNFEPSEQQVAAMTAHAATYAADDDEQEAFLRMLGISPTPSGVAVAIAKRRTQTVFCRNGHKRDEHSTVKKDGYARCDVCRRASRKKHAA